MYQDPFNGDEHIDNNILNLWVFLEERLKIFRNQFSMQVNVFWLLSHSCDFYQA